MKRSRLLSQARTNEAEVVANSGQDDVGGVALAALEAATAEVPISLHVANDCRRDGFFGRIAALRPNHDS